MKVDIATLNNNQALIEKLISLNDFNTMLLNKGKELLVENDNLRMQNEELTHRLEVCKNELTHRLEVCKNELEDRKETFKVVTNRHREKIDSLTLENHILKKKLEDLEG